MAVTWSYVAGVAECIVMACRDPVVEGESRCWQHAGGALRDDLPDEPERPRIGEWPRVPSKTGDAQ